MPPFTIRAAGLDDWRVIAEFNQRLAEESEGKRLEPELLSAGVQAVLADAAKGRYFVAAEGDRIVGQMMHTWEWSDWRNGEIWWLQSVYVHPDFRRRGIFRLLFEHVDRLARDNPHVVGIRLYVENANHRAHQTYQSLGMQPAGYSVMEKMFR